MGMRKLLLILLIASSFLSVEGQSPMRLLTMKHAGSSCIATDLDACAFLAATAITDPTISDAIDDLVIAAKAHGWWSKCLGIYPYVGGTATTHKYNLKDPRDLDAAFRITFNGSWTHGSGGITGDGSTTTGDTHILPSTDMTLNDTHISAWSNTNSAADIADIGAVIFPNQTIDILARGSGGTMTSDHYSFSERLSPAVANSIGWFLTSRTSSSLCEVSKNGVSLASNTTTSGTLPTSNIWVGAISGNVGSLVSNRQYQFHTVGSGISISLAATMYSDIAAFQTALGR